MAKSKNDAYAGNAEMPNGRTVEVAYFDATKLREQFGYQPPGHPARKRIGWYWRARDLDGANMPVGPFTSSRKAMQDAIAKNPAPEHTHAV